MRILILEDDPLIALDLQLLVEDLGHDVPWLCHSVASAQSQLGAVPDFAFLDVDLPDGKSFDVASRLDDPRVPFCFVSGSVQGEVPAHLRHARFIAKPFAHAAILSTLATSRAAA